MLLRRNIFLLLGIGLFLGGILGTPQELIAAEYDIRDFGAVGDGTTLNTAAIQAAVDQANADGGGTVIIPPGKFLTGSVILRSGVEIHLHKKATLLGSSDIQDYRKLNRWKALLMAEGEVNISVTGKGTIDGQGAELALAIDSLFYIGEIDSSQYQLAERRPIAPLRPQLIEFVHCTNVRVTGITLRNAASWVQSYDRCQYLVIDKVTVDSDAYWNNDGIDVIDSRNVRITNCNINASDDGICLKSYKFGSPIICDSIYIGNCIVRSSASAVKIGTASYLGFKNIVVENIKVYDTFRSAIAIEMVDGGLLDNMRVENIRAKNTGNAIFIRLGKRNRIGPYATLRNVIIRDVRVEVPDRIPDEKYHIRGPALPFFHNTFPSSLTGLPEHPVENVTLEDIRIIYPGGGNRAYAYLPVSRLDEIPEQANHYPEFSMFGELPAWGFYFRHARGIKLNNIQLKAKKKDYRPAFVFDDIEALELSGIDIQGDPKESDFIFHNMNLVELLDLQ